MLKHRSSLYSIDNISPFIISYSKSIEKFDRALSHKALRLNADKLSCKLFLPAANCISAIGSTIAKRGQNYQWQIQLLSDQSDVNIGIIDNKMCKVISKWRVDEIWDSYWWGEPHGYSYHSTNGHAYHQVRGPFIEEYGDKGDVISVYLNLKDENALFFGKNGSKIKAYDLHQDKEWRVGVAMKVAGSIEIIDLVIS